MSATKKAQIVFPQDLLDEIDLVVGGRKRSDFVVEAARQRLARLRFQLALEGAAGAWSEKDHPETRSQRALTRWILETRRPTKGRMRRWARG